jgi:hypothetical protein
MDKDTMLEILRNALVRIELIATRQSLAHASMTDVELLELISDIAQEARVQVDPGAMDIRNHG